MLSNQYIHTYASNKLNQKTVKIIMQTPEYYPMLVAFWNMLLGTSVCVDLTSCQIVPVKIFNIIIIFYGFKKYLIHHKCNHKFYVKRA